MAEEKPVQRRWQRRWVTAVSLGSMWLVWLAQQAPAARQPLQGKVLASALDSDCTNRATQQRLEGWYSKLRQRQRAGQAVSLVEAAVARTSDLPPFWELEEAELAALIDLGLISALAAASPLAAARSQQGAQPHTQVSVLIA